MPEPVLVREVELPRPRSSGAAVVLVAASAMFTAVAASAFAVRVRMHEHAVRGSSWQTAPERAIPVAVIPARVEPEVDVTPADRATIDRYNALVAEGAAEEALQLFNELPVDSTAQQALSPARTVLADQYL